MEPIRRGAAFSRDPGLAAREIAEQLHASEVGAAVFFCSASYDLEVLERHLLDRFEGVQLLGCTTAGEISPDGYARHGIVGMSFPRSSFTIVSDHCDDLTSASLVRVCGTVRSLVDRLRLRAPAARPSDTFAILLIDGLAGIEEPVLSAITRELGDIPLVGGSAGDDMRFERTVVFHDGAFRSASAAIALVHTDRPFEVFRTQHIRSRDEKMVITEADPVRRVVTEINAEPASDEYARLAGFDDREFAPMELATHPLTVRVGGDDFVRSVRSVDRDERSLTFYCAIDEGIVLSAARATDIVSDLDRLFAGVTERIGTPAAVLGFDCIFRRLELQTRGLERSVSRLLAKNNVIGFSTYGEQFHAMHLNQTFSGIAFADTAKRA